MALNAFLILKGQRSGTVKGSVTQKGREGQILVIGVSHEIVSPRDPASGLPTGKRQHRPFVITKELDAASPIMQNMLVNNENVTEAVFRFWAPQVGGAGVAAENQHFTVTLTNANIASIRMEMLNNKYAENASFAVREQVSFTYQKIEWLWVQGGITANDDWEAPNQ